MAGTITGTVIFQDPSTYVKPAHPLCSRKGQNPRERELAGVLRGKSLTMSYFHRRTSTIIGAKAFHGPVRDGKEWDHLAMVIRRSLLSG